jgi:hypothetical protein
MQPAARQAHDIAREELQAQLLARNVFRITMVGLFGFLAATFYVMAH